VDIKLISGTSEEQKYAKIE